MGRKGMAVLAFVVLGAARGWADDSALELEVKPAASGEKTVYVARESGADGKVRAETRLEVRVTRDENDAFTIKVEAQAKAAPAKVESARGTVGQALARASAALAQADRALEQANGALEEASRALDDGLKTVGLVVGGERRCEKEPRTVTELLGIDEHLVVAGTATRREVTVEVGGRKVACTLHELQVKDGSETRSVSVWLSADAKGSSIVAVKTTEGGTTREIAVEGFVANARTAQPQGAVKVELRAR
ncbi:MAG TPA: hypothetical protein VFF73_14225 [Planctomycetota bacterium]|nr:hypothetical protein [Planctomycetota bacterium]